MFVTALNNRTFGKPDMIDTTGRQYKRTEFPNIYDIRLTRRTQDYPDKRDRIVIKNTGEEYYVETFVLNHKSMFGGAIGNNGKQMGSNNCGRIEMKKVKDAVYVSKPPKKRIKEEQIIYNKPPLLLSPIRARQERAEPFTEEEEQEFIPGDVNRPVIEELKAILKQSMVSQEKFILTLRKLNLNNRNKNILLDARELLQSYNEQELVDYIDKILGRLPRISEAEEKEDVDEIDLR